MTLLKQKSKAKSMVKSGGEHQCRPRHSQEIREGKELGLVKGKHATSTQSRRWVWESVIWPLVLEVNKNYFTIKEYRIKRDMVCIDLDIPHSKVAGGLVSLLNKGILTQDNMHYSIHYKLIPYMRKRVKLDYGTVLREIYSKK